MLNNEAVKGVLSYAHSVIETDANGNTLFVAGDVPFPEPIHSTLDLVTAAVRQLGAGSESGELDVMLVSFRNRMVAVAPGARGNIYVIAPGDVTPGLLLNQIRRLLDVENERRTSTRMEAAQ